MSYPDIDNLDHDPDLAIALGNMVVAWARAETALVKIYAVAAKIHYNLAATAYYRIPTFESRVKVLQAVIEEQQEEIPNRKEMAKHVAKLASLSAARNKWVHALWGIEKKTGKTFVWAMRDPLKKRISKHTKAHDVNDHVAAVRKRTRKLEKFSPLKIELYTSPGKSG